MQCHNFYKKTPHKRIQKGARQMRVCWRQSAYTKVVADKSWRREDMSLRRPLHFILLLFLTRCSFRGWWRHSRTKNVISLQRAVAKTRCMCIRFGRYIGNSYGSGSGQIWLDNLQCTGYETSLAECGHRGWGVHNCIHNKDVTIICDSKHSTRISSDIIRHFSRVITVFIFIFFL